MITGRAGHSQTPLAAQPRPPGCPLRREVDLASLGTVTATVIDLLRGMLTAWAVWTVGGEARKPGADFRIAAAGPAASLALAGACAGVVAGLEALGVAHMVVARLLAGRTEPATRSVQPHPGAPLDGGRILRACLWCSHGNPVRAEVDAAGAGQTVGYLLIATGVFQLFAGGGIGGLWTTFIGWFLLGAARAEQAAVTPRHPGRGTRRRRDEYRPTHRIRLVHRG